MNFKSALSRIKGLGGPAPVVARHLILAMASRIVVGGSSVAVAMVLANAFEPGPFSSFRFFQITLAMLVAIAAPGISISASKLFAQFATSLSDDAPPIGVFIMAGFALAAIVALCLPALPSSFFKQDIPASVWLLSLGMFLSAAAAVPTGAMIGLQQFGRLLILDLLTVTIQISGAAIAVGRGDIEIAIWSVVAAQAIALLMAYASILQFIPLGVILKNARTRHGLEDFRRVFDVAGPTSVIVVALSLQFWGLGRIILSSSDDPKVFAAYSIGMQWFSLANMVPDVIGRTVFPRSVQLATGSGVENRLHRISLARNAIAIVFASTIMVAAAAFLIGPYIIALYGPSYRAESSLIGVFAAASIPYSLSVAIGYQFLARNAERLWMGFVLLQLAVVIATCWNFSDLGAAAGAAALALGSIVVCILAAISAQNRKIF